MGYAKTLAAVLLPAALILFIPACSTDEQPVLAPAGEMLAAPGWPGRESPEACIETLLACYARFREVEAVERYASLLHEEYLWHFQPKDVPPGGSPVLTRDEDVAVTGRIFDNAVMLELSIEPAPWHCLDQYEGEPCAGCMETVRHYLILARFEEHGRIYRGRDVVIVVVVPDEGDGGYLIRAIHDVDD